MLFSTMDATHSSAPLETDARLSWPALFLTGAVAALGYFVVNLVQRRRFYKDLVCFHLPCTAEFPNF